MPILVNDLVSAGLGEVEILVEHQLPLTSRRVDAVLAGQHPVTGRSSYVLVELKQWSGAEVYESDPRLVTIDAYGPRPVLHPMEQVSGYRDYMLDFLPGLADRADDVAAIAYLHNATESGIQGLRDHAPTHFVRMFSGERKSDLAAFLRDRLAPGVSGTDAADELLGLKAGPSRQLLSVAAREINDREQFVLLDQQRVAYEIVLHEVALARESDSKSVVLVTGGPGTGKSVIALSLLGELARQGRTVLHATGSQSFTKTLRKVAGKGSTRVQGMFKYFNSFMDAERNGLDVLILDEAHRIRETSANRYTKASSRTGRPQIDELIAAARVPVFLLDEHQVVRPGELGTAAEIESFANDLGLKVHRISLDDQFRCGGSEAYLRWVQRLLGLVPGGPVQWGGDPNFALDIVDSPQELESRLTLEADKGYAARITAGFCWPWSEPERDGHLVPDVVLEDWKRPWNVKGDRAVGGAPPSALWATDPAGFGQVGCIYTAQGFEYDWNGVILGPDLVWRTDHWVAVRSASKDPAFRNSSKITDDEFDQLVRNVYKVLLTRGMIGTLLFSADEETNHFLRGLV
ncbi:MAG: DUF2075 domain-containing protein [Candidatus Nanopelagicales bacterium]|nr:DUF2075 domain-containing protein [Candidatus Nanopelagicales bacterium]